MKVPGLLVATAPFVLFAAACSTAQPAPVTDLPRPQAAQGLTLPASARPQVKDEPLFVENDGKTRVPYWVKEVAEPCILVVEGQQASRSEKVLSFMGVDRITAEAGPTCVEHVVYEPTQDEIKNDLAGLQGFIVPLSATITVNENDEISFYAPVDMNFDGYMDMQALRIMGAYNASFAMLVYDPARMMFVRNEDLEGMLWPSFDANSRTIKSGGRAGGPWYYSSESRWVEGQIVTTKEETSILGEDPNGKALPRGFGSYEIRKELRNGVMTTVFEGPVKE